ncbi:Protein fantom [Schistosoma japonicum]|nr:Protein fantom [Schistosoma japonicum]
MVFDDLLSLDPLLEKDSNSDGAAANTYQPPTNPPGLFNNSLPAGLKPVPSTVPIRPAVVLSASQNKNPLDALDSTLSNLASSLGGQQAWGSTNMKKKPLAESEKPTNLNPFVDSKCGLQNNITYWIMTGYSHPLCAKYPAALNSLKIIKLGVEVAAAGPLSNVMTNDSNYHYIITKDKKLSNSMEYKNSISSWSKERLEDQYLRLYDDYLTLKKHACKQEERIKKMSTKILRLANDKKESDPNVVCKEDYQEQIEILERKNASLTRKLTLIQNQLNVHKQRITSTPLSARKIIVIHVLKKNPYKMQIEKTIQKLSEQLKERDELINQLKQELQFKEKLHTNDLVELNEQVTSKQRVVLQENLDLIRAQRELREKQLQITNLEVRIREAESNYEITKSTNHQLLQYAYDDAKRENQALKESNEKLLAKLRGQINHLEIMVHDLQQQLQKEQYQRQNDLPVKEQIISSEQQSNRLESTPMKQENKTSCQDQPAIIPTTTTTTQMFAQITGYTVEELEEAVMILRERKSKVQSTDSGLLNLSEQDRDSLKQLTEADTLHVDTIVELDKTRKLLNIQYKINKDYQNEINELSNRFNEYKCESEQCLNEYNQLLNIRTIHIKQLEKQLNEFNYNLTINKHKYQLKLFNSIDKKKKDSTNEELNSIFLTWDFYDFETQTTPIMLIVQNSIDINMTIQYPIEVNDTFMNYLLKEPCIVEMYQVINSNYHTIANGTLNFSQLFTGKDDTIEMTGQGSVIRRQGQSDLFLNFTSDNRSNSKETKGSTDTIKLGTLNYWIRLFQQLLGSTPIHKDTSSHQQLFPLIDLSQNTLTIKIIKITNLSITSKTNRTDYLPSIYFVYQFYNELEYASDIVKENKAPIFNDYHTIQLEMNDKLDNYLRTESLKIYILDNTDPVPETSCLGLATIPLIGLIHNTQQIDGIFEIFSLINLKQQSFKQLRKYDNSISNNLLSCGLLHLKMYWQKPYTTTNCKTVVYNQLNMEESNDLEMEPVKEAAEPKFSKENNIQPSSSFNTSFTSPVDKLHSSSNSSYSLTTKSQLTNDVDQVSSRIPEKIVNKADNQILVQSNDDHPMDNKQSNEITTMEQFQLENNSNEKLNVPTPHPRSKTNEFHNSTINSLNNSIKQNHINSNHSNIQLIQSNNSMLTSTIQWGIDENHVKIELHAFSVDFIENYERRQYLASYLLPEDPNNGNIIFIIVIEPSTTTKQSVECEEIGYAIINIRQIVQNNCQIDHEFIPITANKTDNDETGSLYEIGRLCVSFYGLPALRAIIAEMPQVKLAI